MYDCEICDKEFTSNKKLLSHLERCEKRTRGSVSEYRSEERSTRSRGYESASRQSSRPKLTRTSSGRVRGSKSAEELTDQLSIAQVQLNQQKSTMDSLIREKNGLIHQVNEIRDSTQLYV